MKIILMGPQGSGKGTQGEMLSDKLGIPAISVGNLIKSISENHPRYEEAWNSMKTGELVEVSLVVSLIIDRISQPDCRKGYILDGWARDMDNLRNFDPYPDKVIVINIPYEESIKRLSSRRTCSECGAVYNILFLPPREEGVCDECGGSLVQREDDTEKAIAERLNIYYTETLEVIEHFRNRGVLVEVDGMGTPDEVFERICTSLSL